MANGQLGAEDSPATPFRPFHRKQPGVARSHLGPLWRVICELQNTSVSTDLFPRANSLPSRQSAGNLGNVNGSIVKLLEDLLEKQVGEAFGDLLF